MHRSATAAVLAMLCATALAQIDSLRAPDEVHILERIAVEWTAGDDAGDLIEIRPIAEGARRSAYAYVRDNP
ncbi:MAG: hypothetical protein V2J10_12520, partial [Wenzhouxiangella sp.]|nr:hypothetical protein [Wenzhouxiangella sp.]